MITNKATFNRVKLNLVHYNQWSDVSSIEFEIPELDEKILMLKGKNPKNEAGSGCTDGSDYVLPVLKQTKLTLQAIDLIFQHLSQLEEAPIAQLVIGIMDSDGAVVFYNVHPGVQKPKNS